MGEALKDKKKRLRRSMLFLNAQKPSLIRDAYLYGPDSLMFDLEDAVAENQKDSARFSLYNALRNIDYGRSEKVVRINGLDTPHWREDVRCAVAAGCDSIRLPKTETARDISILEEEVYKAEKEFGIEEGTVLLMAAIESARGVINCMEICTASDRLFGIALSGGDYTKDLQTTLSPTGVELMGARQHMIIAARAAKVQCFDTVYTNVNDLDGFRHETEMIKQMGFDGKSLINPRQIPIVHGVFTPTDKEIEFAKKVVREIEEKSAQGI